MVVCKIADAINIGFSLGIQAVIGRILDDNQHEVYNRKFYTIRTIVHKSEYEDCKGG
jgi:hypothetical protein